MTRDSWQPILGYGALAALTLACLWLVSLAPLRLGWGRELIGAAIAIVAMAVGLRLARHRPSPAPLPASDRPPSPSPRISPAATSESGPDAADAGSTPACDGDGVGAPLSPREQEVLRLLDAGLSNKALARRLSLSENTVKTHLANLYLKLGVGRRTEALAAARRRGLL